MADTHLGTYTGKSPIDWSCGNSPRPASGLPQGGGCGRGVQITSHGTGTLLINAFRGGCASFPVTRRIARITFPLFLRLLFHCHWITMDAVVVMRTSPPSCWFGCILCRERDSKCRHYWLGLLLGRSAAGSSSLRIHLQTYALAGLLVS
jgi:hypothetical protein